MAQNVYEGMFILDSTRYGRDPDGVAAQIAQMIERAGGQMLINRFWEERRLAFPIKGQRRGTYWLTYFRLDGESLGDVRRQYQLNDIVLRALVLKIDPRIVEPLVQHAQTVQTPTAPTEAKPVEKPDILEGDEIEEALPIAEDEEET